MPTLTATRTPTVLFTAQAAWAIAQALSACSMHTLTPPFRANRGEFDRTHDLVRQRPWNRGS
jgi:hypothetical protein